MEEEFDILTRVDRSDYLIRHTTLRQLQILEAIVRHGSFTRAAEELFLTQPTVSMQVKKLAETVGMPLFQQVGRRVETTDVGREVHAAARAILRSLSDLDIRLADVKGLRHGRLRLCVITTAKYFAPEILGAFCEQHPGIDVSLKVTNRERILERLAGSDDDLYVMGQAEGSSVEVEMVPLAPNPLVIVARTDHPLASHQGVTLERLAQERFLLREPGSGIRDSVLKAFHEAGLRPNVRIELGSNEAIKHAVIGGLGIAALSLHSLALDADSGVLVILDVVGFPVQRHWFLVYPRGRELSLAANAFLTFATENTSAIRARLDNAYKAMQPNFVGADQIR